MAKAVKQTHEQIPLLDMDDAEMQEMSRARTLSLSLADLRAIKAYFAAENRNPTDVEMETIAQTWSEHCKHRVFSAKISHETEKGTEEVDGLFKTFIRSVTDRIREQKPGFVVSAFHDNAGFIDLDGRHAVCLKVETHNHPSAIEPYAGANTGLGGVIRDILGAGLGAKPVASVDVFCFGRPDAKPESLHGDSIHPLGIFRGVVRGVRDYGNRMGIPTVAGAIHFSEWYTTNPLVYCGTAGVLPIAEIEKKVYAGQKVLLVGGRTGRDGLHGATFSSASLDTDSHVEDKSAVQIGNPIEEKKVLDFVLAARAENLIEFITDCGAGGVASAAGEMLSELGGVLHLDRFPLKEEGLVAWEIFESESQERMVLGVSEKALPRVKELAAIHDTDCTEIGVVTGSRRLEVLMHGAHVLDLKCEFLHQAPRREMVSEYRPASIKAAELPAIEAGEILTRLMADLNIASREPVIREYDHEVQGNTVLKPLAGPGGDNPQDAAVIRVPEANKYFALGLSLLPQYGESDPYRMGLSSVDEAVRQVVVAGADPDRVAILDNFCMGNPDDPRELGKLVECARAMAEAATAYGAPFISGKDSFYNYYVTEKGESVSIPVTLLVSSLAVIDDAAHVTGATFRRAGSLIGLLGVTKPELGESACCRMLGVRGGEVPGLDAAQALVLYRRYHEAVKRGLVLAAHDLAEGGLAVAAAEAGFGGRLGVELDITSLTAFDPLTPLEALFSESNARILYEFDAKDRDRLEKHFSGLPFLVIGRTVDAHRDIVIENSGKVILKKDLGELKAIWKNGLTRYY